MPFREDNFVYPEVFRDTGPLDWRLRRRKMDPKSGYFDFRGIPVSSGFAGGAATGTAGDVNNLSLGVEGSLEYSVLGTQTILQAKTAATGLDISQDLTNNDGVQYTPGITANSRGAFVIGTDAAFFAKLKFAIADVSGTDDCAFGFRKAEAYTGNFDDYNDLAALNVISGNINIETIQTNAATVTTDTTQDWADGETHTLTINVSSAGVVTYQIDGAAPTVTAAYTFTSGLTVVPFFFFLHDTDVAQATIWRELEWGFQATSPTSNV